MPAPKIMVLRSDRLGDVVLCSGYLHGLVESHPDARVELGYTEVGVGVTDAEQATAEELLQELSRLGIRGTVHRRCASDLAATARWLAGSELLLGNDTGITHLAAAAGCPVVSVSGSQHQGRFVACGPRALTIFADVPCRRCGGLCLFDGVPFPCVAGIVPTVVASSVKEGALGPRLIPAPCWGEDEQLFTRLLRARRSEEHSRRRERLEAFHSLQALSRTLREAERQREEWRGRSEQAEGQQRQSESLCQEAEAQREQWKARCQETEQQRDRWEGLCQEAELDLGRWQELCREAERQEEHWKSLCRQAEKQRDHRERSCRQAEGQRARWQELCREAERQEEHWKSLCRQAEEQRDHWERLCREAEGQRDGWERLCREAEGQRDGWQRLCHEAEKQRDYWRSRCGEAEGLVDRFYGHFPWARSVAGTEWELLPKISIVTPSFQQGDFIEQTIQSVLAQEYPKFEHIIVDAGSTDQTLEILRRYPHLRWVSEPDRGQAHAINKGLLMATGDIVAYLNSDDVYRPGAFLAVARFFEQHPEARMVVGDCDYIDEASETIGHLTARCDSLKDLIRYRGWDRWYCIPQQSVFLRRDLLAETGLFDVSLAMVLDYDMWLRVAQRTQIHVCRQTLAGFRLARRTKTTSRTHLMYYKEFATSRKHWRLLPPAQRLGVSLAAHRHLSTKLLDVAEHYASTDLEPHQAPSLLLSSARYWPVTVVGPRFLLTGLQLAAARFTGKSAVRRLHRYCLDLKWRLQNARSLRVR